MATPPVSGVLAWYAADQITSPPSSGSALATWNDLSGNGYDATQATPADQPTYLINQQNGLAAVSFNGSSDVLGSITFPTISQPFTIYAVVQTSATGANLTYVADGSGNVRMGSGDESYVYVGGTGGATVIGSRSTAWKIITVQVNSSTALIRDDGTQTGSGTVGNAGMRSGIYLGANKSSLFWTGDIGELLVYNAAHSTTDMQTVESYLSSKWGIGPVTGTGAATFSFTGSATGVPTVAGTASGSFAFTGSAAGVPKIAGTGAGAYSFTGSASGTAAAPISATGAGSFTFVGTATGSVPTPPPLPTASSYPAGSGLKPFTYCFYDLLSGQFKGTLPLNQVTFGSQLLQPGSFSGVIDVASAAVQNLDPFGLVEDGRTALLIDYLGSFIWGGICWTDPYEQDDTKRQLTVNATELWSYFANQRVQATDYSAPPFSGITGNSSYMPIWDASGTSVEENGPGVYDPMLIAWQMISDAIYYVPSANLFGGTGILANGYTTPSAYLASGTNTPQLDYLSESYPYSSMQQLGSALNQLATLGLGVGFDYGVDVGGSATGPVTCTVNLSYPRRGRTFANNNLVLDCQRALKLTIPPDATQTANTVYEQGANGALSVSQNAQPLDGGYPILERIMSRSNIQSANVMQVLQQTGAADLAIYSYPVYTPTVTTDLFTGPIQLGQFVVGDDCWWRIPKTDGAGNIYCSRFPQGLNVEARITGYSVSVADAGTSTITFSLCEPPSYQIQGPWFQ